YHCRRPYYLPDSEAACDDSHNDASQPQDLESLLHVPAYNPSTGTYMAAQNTEAPNLWQVFNSRAYRFDF
ncbi:MAG: hypothetical protein ACO1PZ_01280, partial [Gammaproteobacteria bacterium]